MKAFGKTLVSLAGFAVGGPIGAAAAYGVATAAGKLLEPDEDEFPNEAQVAYLFSCLAKVAIADGELSDAEVDSLHELLEELEFDEEGKELAITYFQRSLDESGKSIEFYTIKYREEVGGAYRDLAWLIDHMVALALADGVLSASEEAVIRQAIISLKLPAEVFEQAVVNARIQSSLSKHLVEGFGSGFFITPNGYIITNEHVVEDAQTVLVRSKDALSKAKVIKLDADEDLCLLKIDCPDHPCVAINFSPVRIGQDVFTLGFPSPEDLGFSIKLTKGCVSAISGERDDPRFLQMDATIQGGNSGGPLFCKDSGNLLGINTAGMDAVEFQNVNYAIKSERLGHFIEEHPSVLELINASNRDAPVEAPNKMQHAENCVVQILACGEGGTPWFEDQSFHVEASPPRTEVNLPPELPKDIWIARGGEKRGPYARDKVIQFLESGQFRNEDPAWKEGMDAWGTLGQLLHDSS
jgi:uncharacterized tellurite resistance protein B-like protein